MRFLYLFILIFIFISAGCDDGGSSSSNDNESPDTDTIMTDEENIPEPQCREFSDTPSELKFTDVTAELGLDETGLAVAGSNIVIADINNDGLPDLSISKGSSAGQAKAAEKKLYRILLNNGDGTFKDWTEESGLFASTDPENYRASTFIVFADLNNDGCKDAFNAVNLNSEQAATAPNGSDIYMNDCEGHFSKQKLMYFTPDENYIDPVTSVVFTDYNKDGFLDIYVAHHYGTYGYLESSVMDTIYKGDGTGKFTDVTKEIGAETFLPTEETLANGTYTRPSWGAAACDLDGDGWDELMSTAYGRAFNLIFRNNHGTFENVTMKTDFGSDDNEDYSDDNFFLCYCSIRQDDPYCKDAGSAMISCDGMTENWTPGFSDQPYRLGGNTSNHICADFDNDGDLDIVSVELAHWHVGASSDRTHIMMNDGFPEKPFRRLSEKESGITRTRTGSWNDGDLGGFAADFDNDGKMDFYIASSDYDGTKALLYQQQNDGTFKNVASSAEVAKLRAHGAGLIDYDRDGDYDLVVGLSTMRWSGTAPTDNWITVYRNDTPVQGNRFMIKLIGSGEEGGSNKDAIGAWITIKSGDRKFVREIQGSNGLTGFQQDDLMIIGTGSVCVADEIEIKWPDKEGTISTFKNIPANYMIEINQKSGIKFIKQ